MGSMAVASAGDHNMQCLVDGTLDPWNPCDGDLRSTTSVGGRLIMLGLDAMAEEL